LQGAEISRLLIVFISQSFAIVVLTILGFKTLKRNRKRAQIALFLFYMLLVVGLILNIAFVLLTPTNDELLLRTLYVLTSFFIIFPFVFNLLFINIMLKMEEVFTLPKMILIVVAYGTGCFGLYIIPDGIVFSPTWVPTYSLTFFVIVYIFFTVCMAVPTLFYFFRVYRMFKAQDLKKRYRLYFIGIIIIMAVMYGGIYFITTNNQLFKTVYGFFAFVFEIVSGFCVYYGVGKDL